MGSLLCWNNHINNLARQVGTPTVAVSGGSAVTNYPESNLIDSNNNTEWRRTIAASSTVTLDIATGMAASHSGVAAIALTNLSWINPTTGIDGDYLMCRAQVGSGSFGSNLIFDQRRVMFPTHRYGVPKNCIWVVDPCTASTFRRSVGGYDSVAANQFRFTFTADAAGCTLIVGGVYIFSGLACLLKEGAMSLSGDDLSVVQRPYDGFPYVQKRSKFRRVSARLTDMSRWDVWGGSRDVLRTPVSPYLVGFPGVRASVSAINYTAGKSSPVMLVQDATLGGSPFTALTSAVGGVEQVGVANWDTDLRAAGENIMGYLEAPITAQHVAVLDGATKRHFWEADFSIQEAFGYSL